MIVDGRRVTPKEGASVLEAARDAGVAIPALCHHPALPPDGSCRMCLVEVEGRPGLHASCVLPAGEDLIVHTETDRLRAERGSILRLLLGRYRPGAGRADNELVALAERYGASPPAGGASASAVPVDESNPFIRVDRNACIRCWRCVRACDRLNGVSAIGVFGRGADAHIGFGHDGPMQESACEFCGMCEAVCPTDALTLQGIPPSAAERSPAPAAALCSYCGVGCRLGYHTANGRIVFTSADWSAPANHGLLCVKGRFGWTYVHHPERLTRPLVRRSLIGGEGDDLVEVEWGPALDLIARRLAWVRDEHGPGALAFLASAKCSNEENYLIQKLARQVCGTNNVDHCARLCHAPTVAALTEALGSGAMTNSMDDIVAQAQSVLIVGSNTTEQHPVLGMRLRRAARERGLPIIVADPRRIPLVESAALHLRLRPGTDIALLNGLAHELIANGWVDRAFVRARTEGYETLADHLRPDTPERVAAITGVPAADLRLAARMLWQHRPGALLFAMGITQHTCGTANAFACANLQLLLGNVGVAGGGVNPLRGQNNVQGACDVGALPDVLPGYAGVADDAERGRFEAAWGVPLPSRPGLTVTEILDGALAGGIQALWILGENAAMTDPDLTHVHRCLRACRFLVVQEILPSETARFAHVVLPAAAMAEKAGTYTNTERRVQLSPPVVPPPGQARPDWWIVGELARRMSRLGGRPRSPAPYAGWDDASPPATMDEIAALVPAYGGVSHARLARESVQWPCPSAEHRGTPVLHLGRFPRGRARFTPVSHQRPAESPDAQYPLVLTTGRLLEHYHGGTMTRRVAALDWRVPDATVEIHPADAAACGVRDGQRVRVRSRRGAIGARALVTEGIARGTVFVPFHFAEAAANVLTNAALDPIAKIPEFKACAVALEAEGGAAPPS